MSPSAASLIYPAFGVMSLAELLATASSRLPVHGAYAGEVNPREAWNFLKHANGVMVDVRTQAEWQFVGLPDLTDTRGKLLAISWKHYPTFTTNPQFLDQLKAAGVEHDMPIFFICRSGGRSQDAAIAMTEAGFRYCFNVTDGFEGEPDVSRHRGTASGWKASGLPWVQG